MNPYPMDPRPGRWQAKLSPFWVRTLAPMRRRRQRLQQQLARIDVEGVEHLRVAVDEAGSGVLIVANHSGHADAFAMYEAADRVGTPFYFMSAWQVFAMEGPLGQWVLQRHGCFSVDREGTDRAAFKQGVDILTESKHPLVIFPEGEVYHQNDRVTPFRDGAAAIALTAARKHTGRVLCVPCGMKYFYVDDPMPVLLELMDRLEREILWRPRPEMPLADRIYRLAEGLLALKEVEYLGGVRVGQLPERMQGLADSILRDVEERHGIEATTEGLRSIPERVKEARRAVLSRWEEMTPPEGTVTVESAAFGRQREQVRHDLDDLYLVTQIFSYPGDYLKREPTVERLAETLDKLEEDVLRLPTATIKGMRRVVLRFGEPIDVTGQTGSEEGEGGGRRKRGGVAELSRLMEERVQVLLDEIRIDAQA